jgi:hypothetical protein
MKSLSVSSAQPGSAQPLNFQVEHGSTWQLEKAGESIMGRDTQASTAAVLLRVTAPRRRGNHQVMRAAHCQWHFQAAAAELSCRRRHTGSRAGRPPAARRRRADGGSNPSPTRIPGRGRPGSRAESAASDGPGALLRARVGAALAAPARRPSPGWPARRGCGALTASP